MNRLANTTLFNSATASLDSTATGSPPLCLLRLVKPMLPSSFFILHFQQWGLDKN